MSLLVEQLQDLSLSFAAAPKQKEHDLKQLSLHLKSDKMLKSFCFSMHTMEHLNNNSHLYLYD